MTPSDLKYAHEGAFPQSHFFDRDTMRFFGDTMGNYGVRRVSIRSRYDGDTWTREGVLVDCWELYRRRATKKGATGSTFFDVRTFDIVHEMKE